MREMTDDADDGHPDPARPGRAGTAGRRAPPGPEIPRQHLVDDHHRSHRRGSVSVKYLPSTSVTPSVSKSPVEIARASAFATPLSRRRFLRRP